MKQLWSNMRVTPQEREIIRHVIEKVLGETARGAVFGSRTDDTIRGGDLDLLVEVDFDLENRAATAARLEAELQLALGDQKIDVLLVEPTTREAPVHRSARATAIAL